MHNVVDDDLDDALDDDDDGDDLPFREVTSPAESARRRWLFSFVGFRTVAAARRGAAPGTLLAAWWVPSPPPSVIPSHFPQKLPPKISSHLDMI